MLAESGGGAWPYKETSGKIRAVVNPSQFIVFITVRVVVIIQSKVRPPVQRFIQAANQSVLC